MKHALLLLLAIAAPAYAAPVHVSLRASAQSGPNASGFVTLSQIADLSGGAKAERVRMASVPVGRIPLSGDTRLLTPGDVALKLRQAGFHPDQDVVLEGAKQVSVTSADTDAVSSPSAFAPGLAAAPALSPSSASFAGKGAGGISSLSSPPAFPAAIVIHRSDSVTVVVQQGDLSITAKAIARESGAVGQLIRVHRDGAASDLSATVLDAQTVQLEP